MPAECKVTGTSFHCSPPALEALREENPEKSRPGAVRGFEPPPAASHDGELATGPKARPQLCLVLGAASVTQILINN